MYEFNGPICYDEQTGHVFVGKIDQLDAIFVFTIEKGLNVDETRSAIMAIFAGEFPE